MPLKLFCLLAISAFFLVPDSIAADPPGKKRPLLIYIGGGITHNTVYGSMVERNNQFNDDNIQMKNKTGFLLSVQLEKSIGNTVFLRSGISYLQKQVNPMENSYSIYWDRLKTGYLSIPVLVGANLLPEGPRLNFSVSAGPSFNFRLIDKSYVGPDRVGFKTSFISTSLNAGAAVSCTLGSATKIMLQYNYSHDISNTYVETLWWSPEEPNKKFLYKYKTSSVSLGFQWPL